jgi:hypothetical protein
MKKKIIIIFVMMLLISTVLQVTGTHDEKTIAPTGGIAGVPVLDLKSITGGLFSITVLLENSGDGTAENIQWEMNASGGIFFYPTYASGEFDLLEPYESEKIKIFPAFGLGKVSLNFYCNYEIVNLSCDVDIIQEWRDQAILFLHSFPENIQPDKEWVNIQDYSYFDTKGTQNAGVDLYYENLCNMHKVRVTPSESNSFQELEYLGACKFTNGKGVLEECWITKDLVTSEEAHWEVELVDGE